MQAFNKTFFRFSFGFIGIILVSMAIIFFVGELKEQRGGQGCGENCPRAGTP